jgi:hypothetical protein
MDGKSTIAAESPPRQRMGAHRSAAEVASATAEMRVASEMPSTTTTTTEMRMAATATEMPAAAMATATVTAAAFRRGVPGDREHSCENEDGKPEIAFRHGTLTRRRATNSRPAA